MHCKFTPNRTHILYPYHPWCVVQRKSKVWVSFRIIAEEVSQMMNLGRQLQAIPLCFSRQGNREAEGLCLGRSVLRRCLSRPTVLRCLIFNFSDLSGACVILSPQFRILEHFLWWRSTLYGHSFGMFVMSWYCISWYSSVTCRSIFTQKFVGKSIMFDMTWA